MRGPPSGQSKRFAVEETCRRHDPRELGNLLRVTLNGSTTIDYVIDGLGRRIGKRVDGVLTHRWLYLDGLRPIAEIDAAGNLTEFVYARGLAPEYMIRGGETFRFVKDHLGSVRLVVNAATGDIVQRLDFDAWGRVLTDTAPGLQPFGFAGGHHDPDTGLVRFGARDYDPDTGRWTAKDPLGFAGGDTNLRLRRRRSRQLRRLRRHLRRRRHPSRRPRPHHHPRPSASSSSSGRPAWARC